MSPAWSPKKIWSMASQICSSELRLLGGTARLAFKSSLIHALKDSRVSGPETPAEAIVLYLVVTRVMSRGLAVLPCPMSSRSSARPLPPDLSCI